MFINLAAPFGSPDNFAIVPSCNYATTLQHAQMLLQLISQTFILVRVRIENLDRLWRLRRIGGNVILLEHCCSFSDLMPVRHEVAISTVILEFQEITLRSAVSTLPRHASPATAGCE